MPDRGRGRATGAVTALVTRRERGHKPDAVTARRAPWPFVVALEVPSRRRVMIEL